MRVPSRCTGGATDGDELSKNEIPSSLHASAVEVDDTSTSDVFLTNALHYTCDDVEQQKEKQRQAQREGMCGSFGCTLPDKHAGLCAPPSTNNKRRRAQPREGAFREHSCSESDGESILTVHTPVNTRKNSIVRTSSKSTSVSGARKLPRVSSNSSPKVKNQMMVHGTVDSSHSMHMSIKEVVDWIESNDEMNEFYSQAMDELYEEMTEDESLNRTLTAPVVQTTVAD